MCETYVTALLVDNRLHDAPRLQEMLTKHGCLIKTRIGIHEAGDKCSNQGLIILHMQADEDEINSFVNDIKSLQHVKIQYMKLEC